MSVPPAVDSPDAPAALLAYLGEIESRDREHGRSLELGNRVTKIVRRNDAAVSANVLVAMRIFAVEITRQADGWKSICTCGRRDAGCEHAAALAFAWLGQLREARDPQADPLEKIAAIWRTKLGLKQAAAPVPPAPRQPAPPPKLTFHQQWEPILAAKLGRTLTATEGAFLGHLSNLYHNFRSSQWLTGDQIRHLGFDTLESRLPNYAPPYQGWWEQFPGDPLELWQYIAHDIESSGLEVPAFMRPITNTTAVRARLEARQRKEAVKRWKERFNQLANAAAIPDTTVAPRPLELRLSIGQKQWLLETREQPDLPWRNAPRSFLDRFSRESTETLSTIEAVPAVYAFISLCQDHRRAHYSNELTPDGYGAREFLHRLLSHRLARTLIVDSAGQPLTFSPSPLVWRLTRPAPKARDYELTLHLPDGALLPLTALHLPGSPDLYLDHGVVYRGPPALDERSSSKTTVPAEAIDRPEVLQTLRQIGTLLPPEIEARFVTVPMRARFECALLVDYAGTEIFTLLCQAVSDQPQVQRFWSQYGWNAAPAVRSNDRTVDKDKIHAFDLTAPNAAVGRLPELKVTYDDFNKRWTRRLTRAFPEEFVAWREALPPGVEVLATGELASLLGAPVKARVDFNLIESNVHRDWFDLALALKPEDTTLTPEEIALLLKARGKLVRLPGKGWRRLTVQLEGAPAAALEAAGFDTASIADAALAGEKHRFHTLQLAQSAVADLLPERQAEALRTRARGLAQPVPPPVPAGLCAELRPYQIEGFHFLAFLSANQLGGVLADDMGLGKTVQTLAWLLWLAEQQPADSPLRALVVCPKSVVGNWEAETAKFAPSLKTIRFTSKLADASPTSADTPLIVIANYTQLRLAADYFSAQRWHAVILDEGQFIKTPTSKVAQIARELPGEQRLILTGTPIENRLLDLWSLFSFSLPGLLGTQAAFKRQYVQDNPLALTRLRSRVRHFLLRRTKTQVAADLPARTEEDVLVELEGTQRTLYDAELKRARAELLKVETAREFDQVRFNILASLLRLRQICCHPALIDSAHREAPSAKLEELMERIEALRDEGHQVLVFSQFVTMLELIQEKLAAAGIEHLILTGQTEDRDALVQRFQTEKKHTVFLLSLKAAGFGLNLTAASYVILYDPWWNPAVEAQAIDRTHRIGQSVPVNAYRFIARGTIEEKIRVLQKEKAALAGAIVQEESLASVLDLDALRSILA